MAYFSQHWLLRALCLVLLPAGALWPGLCPAQEQFDLVAVGQPEMASRAQFDGDRLFITDAMGQTFAYQRQPRFDTQDGSYFGYYCAEARLMLRFPAAGRGVMWLGDPQGIEWRRSQQRVVPVGRGMPPGVPGPGPDPGAGPRVGIAQGQVHDEHQHRDHRGSQWGPSAAMIGPDQYWLAQINNAGGLVVHDGYGDNWRRLPDQTPSGLVPDGHVVIVRDPSGQGYRLLTIDPNGRLIDARNPRIVLTPDVVLAPGGCLAVTEDHVPRAVYSVDAFGRLVQMDLISGQTLVMDVDGVRWLPGQPLVAVSTGQRQGVPEAVVFLIDRGGRLVSLSYDRGRTIASAIADGFVPSGHLAATLSGDPTASLFVCAVDVFGELRLYSPGGAGWQQVTGPDARFLPGSHVALAYGPLLPEISVVGSNGDLVVWEANRNGWTYAVVAGGFNPGAPVILPRERDHVFALDHQGQIAIGRYAGGEWSCYLCRDGWDFTPRLQSRQVIPYAPLPPATVMLENTSYEPLIVQIVDNQIPQRPLEIEILPGESVIQVFERDAGAMLEEVYLTPGLVPGMWSESVQQIPLPPQPRYTLVVWAERVTYQYIDRRPGRQPGALPDFDLSTNVSLGVFTLPPDELLRDGDRIDVLTEAAYSQAPVPRPGRLHLGNRNRQHQPLLSMVSSTSQLEESHAFERFHRIPSQRAVPC